MTVHRIDKAATNTLCKGFGFVELLVALLLCTFCVLNVAALQTTAKRANHDSLQRTVAVALATDMVGKMRANRSSLNDYLTGAESVGGESLSPPERPCNEGIVCDGSQMAHHDLWLWQQALDGANEVRSYDGADIKTGGLVNPTACISGPVTDSAGIYTISIVWRGFSKLKALGSSVCGAGKGLYGPNEEFRRSFTLDTYLSP